MNPRPVTLMLWMMPWLCVCAQDLDDPELKKRAKEWLGEYRTTENLNTQERLYYKLAELHPDIAASLFKQIDAIWKKEIDSYRDVVLEKFEAAGADKDPEGEKARSLRAGIEEIRAVEDIREREKLLRREGWYHLEDLVNTSYLQPDVFINKDRGLKKQRRRLLMTSGHREKAFAAIKDREHYQRMNGTVPPFNPRHMDDFETRTAMATWKMDEKLSRTISFNSDRVINNKNPVDMDPEERQCVLFVNLARVALGLRPLVIDTRLCRAAREHAKFIQLNRKPVHESTVAGKETPEDRAAAEETTMDHEFLYAGSPEFRSALKDWFSAEEKHCQLLDPTIGRIGIAEEKGYWCLLVGQPFPPPKKVGKPQKTKKKRMDS